MNNYPEDIRQYDDDPRSPFYDDGCAEQWTGNRYVELLEDISEIHCLDCETIANIVIDTWNHDDCDKERQNLLIKRLTGYIEKMADEQSDIDWQKNKQDAELIKGGV